MARFGRKAQTCENRDGLPAEETDGTEGVSRGKRECEEETHDAQKSRDNVQAMEESVHLGEEDKLMKKMHIFIEFLNL